MNLEYTPIFLFPFSTVQPPSGWRYAPSGVLVISTGSIWRGGTRQRHFDGTNSQPRKLPENAQTPTTMVSVLFRGSGARCVSPLFAVDLILLTLRLPNLDELFTLANQFHQTRVLLADGALSLGAQKVSCSQEAHSVDTIGDHHIRFVDMAHLSSASYLERNLSLRL